MTDNLRVVLCAAALSGCAGVGTIKGRVILPVGAAGKPSVPNATVCKLVRIDMLKPCSRDFGVNNEVVLLSPLRFETSVYDEATASCAYETKWPIGEYRMRAYYIADGAQATNLTLTGPTWAPPLASDERLTHKIGAIVVAKDQTLVEDFRLERSTSFEPPALVSRCK